MAPRAAVTFATTGNSPNHYVHATRTLTAGDTAQLSHGQAAATAGQDLDGDAAGHVAKRGLLAEDGGGVAGGVQQR